MTDLQSIDNQLKDLLTKRIRALSNNPDPEIPDALWRAVDTHSRAAAHPRLSQTTQSRNITVVGGQGLMGRFLMGRFAAAGHTVSSIDQQDWQTAQQTLRRADLAIIAVPIDVTKQVITQTAQHIAGHTILADLTSTKAAIVQHMLDQHPGPVLSLHPMFGPGVQSFAAQRIIACRARNPEASRWVTDLIESDAGIVIDATPEEHDRMMILVQVVRHFATICLGTFLAQNAGDLQRTLDFASPIYRIELDMVERLFAQDAALYADILLSSPDSRAACARFAQTVAQIAEHATVADRDAIIALFNDTARKLAAEPERALKESAYLVDALSAYLLATE